MSEYDLQMIWKPYVRDRLIATHPSGFVVIKPVDAQSSVDVFCAICDHAMRSRDDEIDWRSYGCCNRCAQRWAHSRKDAWMSGWRPSAEQVLNAESERLPLHATLSID